MWKFVLIRFVVKGFREEKAVYEWRSIDAGLRESREMRKFHLISTGVYDPVFRLSLVGCTYCAVWLRMFSASRAA